jgi:hypothetical protein
VRKLAWLISRSHSSRLVDINAGKVSPSQVLWSLVLVAYKERETAASSNAMTSLPNI